MIALLVLLPIWPCGIACAQSYTKYTKQVFTSASRGSTTSAWLDIGDATGLVSFLDVTANTGTNPTLDVKIQDSTDGVVAFDLTGAAFTQVTGSTSNQTAVATRAPARFIRVVSTVGGTSTPKFTFTISVMANRASAVAVTTQLGGALAGTQLSLSGTRGETVAFKSISEEITLSTGGATTDSAANLLPANSLVVAVVARVTTTITTATDWKLGDANVAGRFTAANSTLTAGTTDLSSVQWLANTTSANAGPIQIAAAKLRVTTTGTPGAGKVLVTVFYIPFTAPTS